MIMRHASRAVSDLRERRCAKCGKTSKITCNMERDRFFFVPFRTRKNPAASKSHPRKKTYLHNGNSLHAPASWTHTKRDTSDIMQPTEHPRTSPPGSRESEHMPLYPFCLCLQESEISQAIAAGVLQA